MKDTNKALYSTTVIWYNNSYDVVFEHFLDLPTKHSQFLGSFGIANKGKTYVAQIPGFVIPTLKVSVEKFQGFCDLSNFYLVKLFSQPLLLEGCKTNSTK